MGQGYERALKSALEMLRSSDKFRAEIERRLTQKGHSPETIRLVFDWLDSKKLLDDRRVATESIRVLREGGNGTDRIRMKLLARGASEDLLEGLLSLSAQDSEVDAIHTLIKKRLKPLSTRGSMGRYLASRGFPEDQIESALNTYFSDDLYPGDPDPGLP